MYARAREAHDFAVTAFDMLSAECCRCVDRSDAFENLKAGGAKCGGCDRDRTCDPYHVKVRVEVAAWAREVWCQPMEEE